MENSSCKSYPSYLKREGQWWPVQLVVLCLNQLAPQKRIYGYKNDVIMQKYSVKSCSIAHITSVATINAITE